MFCVLFAAWNLLALVGHEAARHFGQGDFIDGASWFGYIASPIAPLKMLYFLTKMDHLLYIPALLCLVMALRILSKEALQEKKEGGEQ